MFSTTQSMTAIKKNKFMKNLELLKGLSIEELQERNEFTAIEESGSCTNKCTFGDIGVTIPG